jgi:hypothetical protein
MKSTRLLCLSFFVLAALAWPCASTAQDTKTAVIWQDRGDVGALDLVSGPGGREREPGTDFRFIREFRGGTWPKFEVEDERGTKWIVKLGPEAKPEAAATRLLWAAGYFVDEDHYRPQIRIQGLKRLRRGQKLVSHGDVVTGARLEREWESKMLDTWSWYDNPFVGTREFNGLRVMMALLNNWDLKVANNGVFDPSGSRKEYEVTDLGATFGRTGNSLTRTIGRPKDYAKTRFVKTVAHGYVDFVLHSRPFFLSIFNFRGYRIRQRMERVGRHIPVADARWIGDRLAQLSTEQIRDCFRAAGFSPADVETNTRVVMQRIAVLEKLNPQP